MVINELKTIVEGKSFKQKVTVLLATRQFRILKIRPFVVKSNFHIFTAAKKTV